MRNPYRALEKTIGYRFRRRHRLEVALTHPSYRYENEDVEEDNQRLEFLGDAVLGMVTGAYLFRLYPDMQEGELTKLRSRLTSGAPWRMSLSLVKLAPTCAWDAARNSPGDGSGASNLTDALEAILGAAYEDGGIKAVEKIFRAVMVPYLESLHHASEVDNPKGHLQEVAQQRWRVTPRYRIAAEQGPSHRKTYTVEVLLRDKAYGTGQGTNKRMAQAEAAREALQAVEALDELEDRAPSAEQQGD